MKLFKALIVFEVRDNDLTREQLKSIFRKLTLKNHPDHGGDAEKMKEILEAYETLKNQYSFIVKENKEFEEDENFWKLDNEEIEKAYKKIFHLDGLKIEICGYWIWVTGETYTYKEVLKKAGFYYAKKKVAWYWKPANSRTHSKGTTTLVNIRKKYGSMELRIKTLHKIS